MKYILLCMCLLSLLGCGTDTNTQQDTKPTTTANEQVKTEQDARVMAAKQALSSVIMRKPSRRQQLLLRIIQIMQTLILFVALLRLYMAIQLKA